MFSTWHGVWGFRRTASDKISRDKTLNIARYAKYDGYLRGRASVAYKFYDKKKILAAVLKMKLFLIKN